MIVLAPFAMADVTTTVSLTSDYVFRGISLNDEGPALQASLDYSDDDGFYAGAWASQTDNSGDEIEVDYYAGYSFESSDITWDLGYVRYTYPGVGGDSDSGEFYIGAEYKSFSYKYYQDNDLDTKYHDMNVNFDLSENIGMTVHIGQYDTQADDYADYGVSFSRTYSELDFVLAMTKSDLEDAAGLADSRIAITVSKTW